MRSEEHNHLHSAGWSQAYETTRTTEGSGVGLPLGNPISSELLYIDINDLDILERLVRLIRLHILDRMNDLQPRDRPPENRMLLIQPRGSRRRDKKLTPVRPRSSVGHAQRVRSIVLQIVTELVFELFAPNAFASGAVPEGVSGLNHEFRDHTVENHAFEVSASSVTDKIFDG